MNDDLKWLEKSRRGEHLTVVWGAIAYLVAAASIELLTSPARLTGARLTTYAILTIVASLRYWVWLFRFASFSEPPSRADFSFLFTGAAVPVAFALLLHNRAELFFFLAFVEGCTALAAARSRGVWAALVLAVSFGTGSLFHGPRASAGALLRDLPVYLLLWLAVELLWRLDITSLRIERLFQSLNDAYRKLEDYTGKAEALAVAEERTRLAREIHDTLGHALTTLDVELELAVRLPERELEGRREATQHARSLVKQALTDLRRAVQALRPGDLEAFSLSEALASVIQNFQEGTRIPVETHIDGESLRVPDALGLVLFHAVQEALTNVARHAGATAVTVSLRQDPTSINLWVEDNGNGQDAPHGFGLCGLAERVEALGGCLVAGPGPDRGYRVHVCLPC